MRMDHGIENIAFYVGVGSGDIGSTAEELNTDSTVCIFLDLCTFMETIPF